jgi:MarR family transcriptional regulator, negative regulator of the multidrug operon emrRAB
MAELYGRSATSARISSLGPARADRRSTPPRARQRGANVGDPISKPSRDWVLAGGSDDGPQWRGLRAGGVRDRAYDVCMSHAYAANLLGALGVAIGDRLARAGAAGTAAEALVAVSGDGAGMTIDALARRVGITHSGAVRLVERLVRDGMVQRSRGLDQRSAALALTPEGYRNLRRILARREFELESLLALLGDDERNELVRTVELLLRRIGENGDDRERICRLCDRDACGHSRGDCPVSPGA